MEKIEELKDKIKYSKQRVFTRQELFEMIDIIQGHQESDVIKDVNCVHKDHKKFSSGYNQCNNCRYIWKD